MTSSFKLCTSGQQRCAPENEREAWHCQVHHSKMRCESIADHIGISYTALTDAVNPHKDNSPLAARHHAAVLELTADNLAVVSYYAKLQHAVVYALPKAGVVSDSNTAAVVREFGEFLTKLADARGDRKVTTKEAAEVRIEGEQAIAAIVAIIDEADREAVDDGVAK